MAIALALRAAIAARAGDRTQAAQDATQAVARLSNPAPFAQIEVWAEISRVHAARGDLTEARAALSEATALHRAIPVGAGTYLDLVLQSARETLSG